MHLSTRLRDIILGALGGIVGAFVGCLLFEVIARQGFYAMVLPGALTGLGCGSLSRDRSMTLGIACAVVGAIAGVVAEWRFAPFIIDNSLGYFVTHLHQVKPFSLLLIAVGSVLAFWFGLGRNGGAWLRRKAAVGE